MRNLILSPLNRARNLSRLSICCADVESWGTKSAHFRCGSICFLGKGNKERVQTFFNLSDFFNSFRQFDVVYFYNITYDSQFLRNYAFESKKWQEFAIESGQRLLGITFHKKTRENEQQETIIFKDLLPFCQTSLKLACKEHNCVNEKYDVDFDNCTAEQIQRHCEQDVKMLRELLDKVRKNWWSNFNVDICKKRIYSLPSATMQVFRTNFLYKKHFITKNLKKIFIENPICLVKYQKGKKPITFYRKDVEEFCREAYKGGFANAERTELFENVVSYDIISAYPFAIQAIRFPVGKIRWTQSRKVFLQNAKRVPSVAKVTMFLNRPLICGIREGKLVRLQGKFTETLTSFEIFRALKFGGKIIKFHKGLVFLTYDKHNSFARFERKTFKMKTYAKGGQRTANKLSCNSFYGKLGQKHENEKRQLHYIHSEQELSDKLLEIENTTEFIPFSTGGVMIETKMQETHKPFMFVLWAALITAFVRLYLIEQLIKVNGIDCDTDSVYLERAFQFLLTNTIPKKWKYQKPEARHHLLGFWDKEHDFEVFRALAPKFYAGKTIGEDWCYLIRAKGVPRSQHLNKFYYPILLGEKEISTEEYVKPMGCMEGLRAKDYLDKEGVFGGVRITRKTCVPEKKNVWTEG